MHKHWKGERTGKKKGKFTAINFDENFDLHTNNVYGKFSSQNFSEDYSYEENCIDLFVVKENKSAHFCDIRKTLVSARIEDSTQFTNIFEFDLSLKVKICCRRDLLG